MFRFFGKPKEPVKLTEIFDLYISEINELFCWINASDNTEIQHDEVAYFLASLIAFQYFRATKTEPTDKSTAMIDQFYEDILRTEIQLNPNADEAVALARRRYSEYTAMFLPARTVGPDRGEKVVTLLLHAFESIFAKSAKSYMIKIYTAAPVFDELAVGLLRDIERRGKSK